MKNIDVMNWILENKSWIFSGIGVTVIMGIVWLIKFLFKKKKSKTAEDNRTIHLSGDKSVYIEKHKGDITIQ